MEPSEVTGRIPGRTGVLHAPGGQVGRQPLVLGGLEEELGDAEVGHLQLGGQEVTVALGARRPGMSGRMGRHADREPADGPGQLHQLGGVGQLPRAGAGVRRGIAAERHQVLHARLAQRDQDVGQLQPAVGHADQVRHRIERGGVQHAAHQVERALPGGRATPVGHRDERGAERLRAR